MASRGTWPGTSRLHDQTLFSEAFAGRWNLPAVWAERPASAWPNARKSATRPAREKTGLSTGDVPSGAFIGTGGRKQRIPASRQTTGREPCIDRTNRIERRIAPRRLRDIATRLFLSFDGTVASRSIERTLHRQRRRRTGQPFAHLRFPIETQTPYRHQPCSKPYTRSSFARQLYDRFRASRLRVITATSASWATRSLSPLSPEFSHAPDSSTASVEASPTLPNLSPNTTEPLIIRLPDYTCRVVALLKTPLTAASFLLQAGRYMHSSSFIPGMALVRYCCWAQSIL